MSGAPHPEGPEIIMESWKKTFAVIWSGQLASILSSEVVAYSIIFWMSL